MLLPNQVGVLFERGAEPKVRAKGAGFTTDQTIWNTLAQSFDVQDLQPIFPSLAQASKWSSPEDEEMSRWYTVFFDGDIHDLADVVNALETVGGVLQVAPVPIGTYDAVVPNDPSFSQQNWLNNTAPGGRDIRAQAAWYHETGSSDVVVAVGDSGVDWMHPDLGGTGPDYIDGNIWINQTEWNGTPGVDDDGNGYIDDIRGWDFVTGVTGEQSPPQDTETPDNDPMDYEGHGTAVAGCVAAIGMNGVGVIGTAFTGRVMALRVGWLPEGAAVGVVNMGFAASALQYARFNGAKVFNASWGSSAYPPLVAAVNAAVSVGMTITSAAGNDDDEVASYLSGRSDVIAVAATNSTDGKASFSSYGTWVDVSAPGQSIFTTMYNRTGSGSTLHTYGTISGTSFSSPITAGMAAIIYSAFPGISGPDARAMIVASTDFIDDVNAPQYAGKLGSGRINLLKIFGDTRIEVPEQLPDLAGAVSTLALEPGAEIAVLGGFTVVKDWLLTQNSDLQILGGWDATYTSRDALGNPSVLEAASARPAVRVRLGVGAGTVLDGFRVTGGAAEQIPFAPVTGYFGGGMLIENSDITLRNLIVEGNVAGTATGIGGGGGIAIIHGSPTLENVEITGNTGASGSGLYVFDGNPQFVGLNVHDNISHPGPIGTPPNGGGVHIVDSPTAQTTGTLTITNSTISGHNVGGLGGGIYLSNSDLILEQVEISGNTGSGGGGGLHAASGSVTATDLTVTDNIVDGANKSGGGVSLGAVVFDMDGGAISGNSATLFGGGISALGAPSVAIRNTFLTGNSVTVIGSTGYLSAVPSFTFENNTVADNDGASVGANGIYAGNCTGTVSRNIFAFNGGTGSSNADGVACATSSLSFDCNLFYQNIQGNVSGCPDPVGSNGNVEADPQFCDLLAGDFSIPPSSPAAASQSGGCGTIGADAETCVGTGVDDPAPNRPSAFLVKQNIPNPFNPVTEISFALPTEGRVQVTVYDARGRQVTTLLDRELPAGDHSVRWDGRDATGARVASGIYMYEVRSGEYRAVKKMGLIK
jgi:subtilisin family serine protease